MIGTSGRGKPIVSRSGTLQEELMRKYILTAAMAAAVLSAAAFLPNRADAMTITAPAGLNAAAATVDPVEHVWCNWRGCWGGGYWGPRPYWGGYGVYGMYRPYGFYRPYGWGGWGYRRW
jgi:hypothetical protein